MRPLVDAGYIYIAQPPLYGVALGNNKSMTYLDSDEELESYLSQLPSNVKPKVQRYKGLGEMDYDQLADTTMDAQNRRLLRVDPADAEEAEAVIDMLMGGDVPPRRKFIEDNATACDSSPMQAYQRRFSQDVAPQYVDIRAGGPK